MDTTYFMKLSHAQAAMKAADEIYALRQRVQELEKQNKELWESFKLPRNEDILAIERLTAERDELLEANRIACEDLVERHDRIVELKQQRDDLVVVLEELSLYVAYNGDDWVQKKAKAAIASVKEK